MPWKHIYVQKNNIYFRYKHIYKNIYRYIDRYIIEYDYFKLDTLWDNCLYHDFYY